MSLAARHPVAGNPCGSKTSMQLLPTTWSDIMQVQQTVRTTTVAPLTTAAAQPTLRLGSKGAAVVELQKKLAAKGFSPGAADGDFGAKTLAAVKAFQKSRHL